MYGFRCQLGTNLNLIDSLMFFFYPHLNYLLLRYLALYAYKPQKADELELRKGEMYRVTEKCQDGWFKGTSLRTAASGVFPGNYVTPVSRSVEVGGYCWDIISLPPLDKMKQQSYFIHDGLKGSDSVVKCNFFCSILSLNKSESGPDNSIMQKCGTPYF